MTSLNSSGLIQVALWYFSAAPTSTVICIYFMIEILERCIDLCFVSHMILNSVIGYVMVGKNVSTVWKVSILNNWITRPTKVGIILFSPACILHSNFKRDNICRKWLSLFWLWRTMSQEIFDEKLFGLFLLLVNDMSWT